MSVFGKKLADQGIYNMRHQDHGDRDRYCDGFNFERLIKDSLYHSAKGSTSSHSALHILLSLISLRYFLVLESIWKN